MNKKIQDMTREELQQMLDSYTQETGHIKEWMIDRAERVREFTKDINHQKKAARVGCVRGGEVSGRIAVNSGQILEAQKLSRNVKTKKFKQRNVFEMFHNGVSIGQYPRIVDIAKAYGCSIGQMSLYISNKKEFPEGYVFTKKRIREMSKAYIKRKNK